jgi:hypothetical protein
VRGGSVDHPVPDWPPTLASMRLTPVQLHSTAEFSTHAQSERQDEQLRAERHEASGRDNAGSPSPRRIVDSPHKVTFRSL